MLITILTLWEKRKGTILFASGIILGLVIGLIFAWGIWPVKWSNATPGHLRSDFQRYYLNAVADEYSYERNIESVREKLGLNLPAKANPWVKDPALLEESLKNTIAQADSEGRAAALGRLAQDLGVPLGGGEAEPVISPTAPAEEEEQNGSPLLTVLGLLLIVIALVVGGFFIITRINAQRLQKKANKSEGTSMAGAYGVVTRGEELEELAGDETAPPVSSFVATYVLGDDFFDPSFSIEVGNDFLGECGVGISESIGIGDPKKVTGLEAWLFDKSDIRTVTTVLASDYAFNDPSLSAKLAAKGDLVQIQPGLEVTLETTALRITARVKELEYAQGDLPPNSFFQKVSIELRAWVKSGEETPLT